MKGQHFTVLLVALGLIGSSALALSRVKAWQKLGPPGVRVVPEPIPGVESLPEGTNRFFVAGTNSIYLPPRVLEFHSQVRPVDKTVYDWLPKDTTYGQRLYEAPDGFQSLNQVVLMGSDRTSIHQPQACLPRQGWRTESTEQFTLEMDRPHPYRLPVQQLILSPTWRRPGGEPEVRRGLFLHWYVTADELTADARTGMWSLVRKLVHTGELQRWAYVIYFSVCAPGQEQQSLERMRGFIRASAPEFQLFPPSADSTQPEVAREK